MRGMFWYSPHTHSLPPVSGSALNRSCSSLLGDSWISGTFDETNFATNPAEARDNMASCTVLSTRGPQSIRETSEPNVVWWLPALHRPFEKNHGHHSTHSTTPMLLSPGLQLIEQKPYEFSGSLLDPYRLHDSWNMHQKHVKHRNKQVHVHVYVYFYKYVYLYTFIHEYVYVYVYVNML